MPALYLEYYTSKLLLLNENSNTECNGKSVQNIMIQQGQFLQSSEQLYSLIDTRKLRKVCLDLTS